MVVEPWLKQIEAIYLPLRCFLLSLQVAKNEELQMTE